MKINYSDITFVLQGNITIEADENITLKAVKSIRQFYPESKIIVSTWSCDQKIE
ncbi:hypothetical protein J3L11_18900, partial [Shewanella sp. 4t3-1-2LB]|nr:hypothetical protein [Shewanella sp. 4t3-1-2LB]